MICKCPECKKKFDVLWPHMWAYKRGSQYYCSWKCLRADEQKGVKDMGNRTKVPEEIKRQAIQAAIDGKHPYDVLRPYTSDPKAMWTYIKSMVKQKDPDLYAKIPDLRTLQQAPEATVVEAVEGMRDAADKFFYQCEEMDLMKAETPETPRIFKPVVYNDMAVREVEGVFAKYRRVDANNGIYIDVEIPDGVDTLSYTCDQWRNFRAEMDKAALILGVEL